MNLFFEIVILISGLFLVTSGLVVKTKEVRATLYFKVIPVMLGFPLLVLSMKLFGVI